VVFIVGCEEGLIPYLRQGEEFDLEEERRLFYVGITRAKERLHISYAFYRARYGSFSGGASMFIGEIPWEVLDIKTPEPVHKPPKLKQTVRRKKEFEDYSQIMPDYSGNDIFNVGAFVRHPKFGRGRITEISGTGDNLMLTVLFGTQKKKILPKYANLVPA